jgi:hypothetical protein
MVDAVLDGRALARFRNFGDLGGYQIQIDV